MSRGWITSSTFTSSGMRVLSIGTGRTSKLRCSSWIAIHGPVGRRPSISSIGRPNTGIALITPITGRCACIACAIARVMSYSSSRSRSGESTGMATACEVFAPSPFAAPPPFAAAAAVADAASRRSIARPR